VHCIKIYYSKSLQSAIVKQLGFSRMPLHKFFYAVAEVLYRKAEYDENTPHKLRGGVPIRPPPRKFSKPLGPPRPGTGGVTRGPLPPFRPGGPPPIIFE
jgi:hypothetical protein